MEESAPRAVRYVHDRTTRRLDLKRYALFLCAAATLALAALVPHGQSISIAGAAGANGSAIYASKCASCHQANGQGLPGAFPPLAKNAVVTGDATKVSKIVLNGLTGAVTVDGKTYNGAMPAWKGQLSNAEIAAVITYIRSNVGNKAAAVTEAQVAAAAK